MNLNARITGSITRAQALDLIATLAADLANPYIGERIAVCAEFCTPECDDEWTYFGIGNYGTLVAYGAVTVPDPEAEAQAAEDARAARIESSYLNGR